MRRVSVVGNSGSGKTTFGRELARRLDVPFVELDGLVHQPGWEELPTEDLRAQVAEVVAGDRWVVDGNYRQRVGDLVLDRADTVVWLDLGRWRVRRRIVARTLRRVVTRQELWNGNREPWSNLHSLDPQRNVIVWSWRNHDAYRAQYAAEMAETPSVRWLRLRTPRDVRRLLADVRPIASS